VQQQLVLHCELMADRVALIDPPSPQAKDALDPRRVLDWRQQFDSSYAALYYPWVLAPDPLRLRGEVVRALPPCGHVAGIIARADLSVGVHRAPANYELAWAQGFSADVPVEWQEVLNPLSINCLRPLPGRGLRLYGARTLSSNTQLLYLNVRRLLLMIERALRLSLQWTVFEPNDFNLRQTLIVGITGFLEELRRRGALAGRSAEEAYFVQCDLNNNPPFLSDLGRLIIDVGVAPTLPAEFVVVRIGRTQDELEMTELEKVQ
jgi:phage tail sheath protein FI